MRRLSLRFTAPGKVALVESSVAAPAAGQVLVQTRISAISPGTEMLVYRGQVPVGMAVDDTLPSLQGSFTFPLAYGYSLVGRVVQVGEGIDPSWQDRDVFSFHPHEGCFLASPDELLPVPTGIGPEDAVLLPSMETAVNFLMDGRPLIGEQVAVLGQGVVGLLTTALLSRMPVASLVTMDALALRRKASLDLGATASIDPDQPNAVSRAVAHLQGDRDYPGADLTYELSGNPAALDTAVAVTGFSGRVVVGSWYGTKKAPLDFGGRFHRSRIQLISSQVSTIAPEWTGRWTKSRRFDTVWKMLREVRPARLVTHRYPIAEASKAYQLLDEHPEETIQVLFTYDESV